MADGVGYLLITACLNAVLRAGSLLRGGLLRRNVRALFRNGGGGFGGCCVLGGHLRSISFCGDYRGQDMDHSGAAVKQADSVVWAMERRLFKAGRLRQTASD